MDGLKQVLVVCSSWTERKKMFEAFIITHPEFGRYRHGAQTSDSFYRFLIVRSNEDLIRLSGLVFNKIFITDTVDKNYHKSICLRLRNNQKDVFEEWYTIIKGVW